MPLIVNIKNINKTTAITFLMMTVGCPCCLTLINDSGLMRFRARVTEDLNAIEVIINHS